MRLNSRGWAALIGALAIVVGFHTTLQTSPAQAQDDKAIYSGNVSRLSDEEIDRRIAFIEERMDDGQLHAQIWQYGFTAGYGGAAIAFGGVFAPITGDKDARVNYIVTSVKAAFGTARLLLAPNPGRHGGQPIRDVEGDSREARIERLIVAEELLENNVRRARSRWDWRRHAGNVAVNMAGFGVIWALGEEGDAIESAVVGIAVGTIMGFSMPWRYTEDLADYKTQLLGYRPNHVKWALTPVVLDDDGTPGLGLRVEF